MNNSKKFAACHFPFFSRSLRKDPVISSFLVHPLLSIILMKQSRLTCSAYRRSNLEGPQPELFSTLSCVTSFSFIFPIGYLFNKSYSIPMLMQSEYSRARALYFMLFPPPILFYQAMMTERMFALNQTRKNNISIECFVIHIQFVIIVFFNRMTFSFTNLRAPTRFTRPLLRKTQIKQRTG